MDERMSGTRPVGPSGWAVFAGAILLIVGMLNLVYGIAALVNPRIATVTSQGSVVVWDVSAWGWIRTILGIGMVAVSLGLFAVMEWARWVAIVIAVVNAIAAIALFTAFPLWATLVIALDVIVIYQLSMHWTRPAERVT